MVFGWFKKNESNGSKPLAKAEKLSQQGRWAEALSYYEDALECDRESQETTNGLRICREQLVGSNIQEAKDSERAGEMERALEHAKLAVELAGQEEDLKSRATAFLEELDASIEWEPDASPGRMFESHCSCASPSCGSTSTDGEDCGIADNTDPHDLFDFYLESMTELESAAYSRLGTSFKQGFVFLQHAETEMARPLLEDAEINHPDSEGVQQSLGLLAALEENPEEAKMRFEKALQLNSKFAPAAHQKAQTMRDQGKAEEAVEFLNGWLNDNGDDGDGFLLLALSNLEANKLDGAVRAARTAKKLLDDEDNPRPELVEGFALRKSGKIDEAITVLENLAARFPTLQDCLETLGELLIEKGGSSAEKAAKLYQRLCQLNPEQKWRHLLRTAEALTACGQEEDAAKALDAALRECGEDSNALAAYEKVKTAIAQAA